MQIVILVVKANVKIKMITPHRFLNFRYCLINVVSIIIECLLEQHFASLNQLLKFCQKKYREVNEEDILLGVSFLFAVGKVNYDIKQDIVSLTI